MAVDAGLYGGLLGSVVGTVGGIVQGIQQRAEQSSLKRRFRKGVNLGEARTEKETYDILQSPEYQIARSFALGTYGQEAPSTVASLDNPINIAGKTFFAPPTGNVAFKPDKQLGQSLARQLDQVLGAQRQLAAGVDNNGRPLSEAEVGRLRMTVESGKGVVDAVGTLDSGQLNQFGNQLGRYGLTTNDFQKFRASQLGGLPQTATATMGPQTGIETPLSRSFKSNLSQSMVSRGIYDSQAAAAAEASGLSAFEYEQQQRMLPTLLGLSSYGSDVYHRYESANIGRETQKATGGVGVYGAANPFFGAQSPAVAGIQGGLAGLFSGGSLGLNLQNAFQQQDFNAQYLDMLRTKMKVG